MSPTLSLCDTYTFGNPFHLSHDSPDDTLRAVQQHLTPRLHREDGRAGLLDAIRQIEGCEALGDEVTLDLISHSSSSEQVLVFDGWLLQASEDLARFCKQLGRLSRITKLRLLGCGTANSGPGCHAMNLLREMLGIPSVLGTTTLINTKNFPNQRFLGHLSAQSQCATPQPYDWTQYRLAAPPPLLPTHEKRALSASAAKARAKLQGQLEVMLDLDRPHIAPGLLLEPLETYSVPLGDSGHTIALEVLLQHEYLRVRSSAEDPGVIYPLHRRTSLAPILDQKPTLPYRAPV